MNTVNQPKTLEQYIKWLKTALKKDYLYDHEEYIKIRKELYQAKKLKTLLSTEEKSHKGFGYTYEPFKQMQSQFDLSDSSSGTDDGVRSESEQPEQSGESECSETA